MSDVSFLPIQMSTSEAERAMAAELGLTRSWDEYRYKAQHCPVSRVIGHLGVAPPPPEAVWHGVTFPIRPVVQGHSISELHSLHTPERGYQRFCHVGETHPIRIGLDPRGHGALVSSNFVGKHQQVECFYDPNYPCSNVFCIQWIEHFSEHRPVVRSVSATPGPGNRTETMMISGKVSMRFRLAGRDRMGSPPRLFTFAVEAWVVVDMQPFLFPTVGPDWVDVIIGVNETQAGWTRCAPHIDPLFPHPCYSFDIDAQTPSGIATIFVDGIAE